MVLAVVLLFLLAAAAGAGWWFLGNRQSIPDWERLTQVDLAKPAGDPFSDETPWVNLVLAPGRPGEANAIRLAVQAPHGTPVPSQVASPMIEAASVQLLFGGDAPQMLPLQEEADGAFRSTASFDTPGWWRLRVELNGIEQPVYFYLLLPDPNVNGPNAVGSSSSSEEGRALFGRVLTATTGLRTVRFTQWIADGRGNDAVSEHAVSAGGDGEPAGFSYRAAGGMDAVVIGTTRWVRLPGDLGWQRQEGAVAVPPAEWGEEYFGATGFAILGEEEVDGEPCQIVAFVVPELSDPRRQTVAWYVWWVGNESGQVRREAMVSRLHYMLNAFGQFNEPVHLVPPEDAATPATGTPRP